VLGAYESEKILREGAFWGCTLFLYKEVSAAAIGLASALLGYGGKNSIMPQPESALRSIRLLFGIGPDTFILFLAYFVRILPITKVRFDEIRWVIEER
jgi:Na+/melibiose symporter-like transporter